MAKFSKSLELILKKYKAIQDKNTSKTLNERQKKWFVYEMKRAYGRLSSAERIDVLIPARPEFVADRAIIEESMGGYGLRYDIRYNWPSNDGFLDAFHAVTLHPGSEYDRIGESNGRFLACVAEDGTPASYLERAIPYYIPESNIEDSPAYHRYKVLTVYPIGDKRKTEPVYQGMIAQAFWTDPDDGGGIQTKLSRPVNELGAVLYERKHKK